MQGQRGTIDSYPDAIDFDQGPLSDNSGMNQQTSWSIFDSMENRLPNSVVSSPESYFSPGNSTGHDYQRFSRWDSGEPSSSLNRSNQVMDDGTKVEHGWSSQFMADSGAAPGTGPRLEEGQFERNKMVLRDAISIGSSGNLSTTRPLLMQTSRSTYASPNMNPNSAYMGNNGSNEQGMDAGAWPNLRRSGGIETDRIQSASFSDHVGSSSGCCGSAFEEDDGGSNSSLGSWGLSCKRKALEGTSKQSHPAGSSGCFTKTESTMRHAVPAHTNNSCGFSLSTPPWSSRTVTSSEQLNQRINGVASDAFPPINVTGHAESSLRNFGRRENSGQQQLSVPFNLSRAESAWHSNVSSYDQSSRSRWYTDSLGSRLAAGTDARASTNASQNQSQLTHISGSPTNMHPSIWDEGPICRLGTSPSSFNISAGRGPGFREEINLRNMRRNNAEHAIYVPAIEMRNLGQDPTNWSLSTGNTSTAAPSTSQLGASSIVRPLPTPSWVPHQNPPTHNQQRLLGFAPWALFPSVDTDTGQSGHFPPLPSVPSSSSTGTDAVSSSGTISQRQRERHPRSAFLMERQGDDALGMLHPLQDVAANIEGRHRLISEIRQVLNAMRRGNNVRVEDSWLFEPFVYNNLPEMHDRHRDMRLDVDNMSYEELLALEERIGDVNTGLSEEAILKLLKQRKYATIMTETPSDMEPCCICREEYKIGDDLGTLNCGHDFHPKCIRQWLMLKNICPICKTAALVT